MENKRIKRIEAFTFLEVIISLLITSIVIASVFSIVIIASNLYGRYFESNNCFSQLFIFSSQMEKDWYCSREIIKRDDGWLIIDGNEQLTQYHVVNNHVIRECSNCCDTFKIDPLNYAFRSDTSGEMNVISLEIVLEINKDTIPLIFSQSRYRRQMMKTN